jgi:DNA-binding XRE family transcriptional regulator
VFEELSMLDREEIGHHIRVARVDRRLTQEELAKLIGVNVNTVSQIENGKSGMTLDIAVLIADTLEWPLDHLARRGNYPMNAKNEPIKQPVRNSI